MNEKTEPENRSLILPTLIVSISSIDPPGLIISMSLIEVAAAFGVSVGLSGQIRSIGSVLAIAVALAMGVLSVRYSYKSLLLGGLLVFVSRALGDRIGIATHGSTPQKHRYLYATVGRRGQARSKCLFPPCILA